jgi:hypothetical protein
VKLLEKDAANLDGSRRGARRQRLGVGPGAGSRPPGPRVLQAVRRVAHTREFYGPQLPLADAIAVLERNLALFKEQQRRDLMRAIGDAYPGEVFSASQVWQQPALRALFVEAGIETVKQLGRWLQHSGVDRVGRDEDGIVWAVSENDLHEDAGGGRGDDV